LGRRAAGLRVEGRAGTILSAMATRAVPAPLAQLPNALTVFRLVLIPVFVALVLASDGGHSWPAAIVFGVAGVTDQIDGFLARRWRVESPFGKIADPLADRLMIDAAVLLLWHAGRLPWAALAIPARDLVILAAYRVVVERGYDFSVNLAGKVATWLLYASLGFVMVTHQGASWPLWIFWAGVALAIGALAGYGVKAKREVRS
jgi:CDP-diacylglycerol--glycerol-3-phosphate 3-phosphatidyltransferase